MIESVPIRLRILAIAMLGASLAAGCGVQPADIQQLNQNEFTLRSMIAADHQRIDAMSVDVRRLSDQIEQLKHGQTEAGATDASPSAIGDRVSKLETEVASLNAGMIATPAPAAGPVAGTTAGAPAPPPSAAPAPAAQAPPSWPNDLDKEIEDAKSSNAQGIKIYRAGLNAMKDGKYPAAVADFTRLQHQFPKSELSEPAEYFAANALYETGKFDQAILQFNDMVMRYPKGRFAGAALLRQAQAFLKLNDRIDARLTLQKLQADHAGTPEASSAGALMKQLASD
jgi:tol-pal system protein YbgF